VIHLANKSSSSLHAERRVQLCALCCGIIGSCQSAVGSEIVKRFGSRVWLM